MKQNKSGFWQRLTKNYSIQWVEDKWMLPVKTVHASVLKLVLIIGAIILVSMVLGALLVTQTSLLKWMGPIPRSIISNDYSIMKLRLDSIKSLSDQRDSQLFKLEQFITTGIKDTSEKKSKLAERKSQSNLSNFAIPPYCCFVQPLSGELTGEFKPDLNHFGLDIAAELNTSIHSIGDGYVIFAGYHKLYGNSVIIVHPNGIESHYLHNSQLLVTTGDYVQKAQEIATIGNTGEFTTGPHLHFELWIYGTQVDPRLFLQLKKNE